MMAVLAVAPALSAQSNTIEKELALGRALARGVERREKLLTDPLVTDFVRRLGGSLSPYVNPGFPVTIGVIADAEVRAIALPGGFVYISSGLIVQTEREAELAGVLAHLMAHIAARLVVAPNSPVVFLGNDGCTRFMRDRLLPYGQVNRLRGLEQDADNMAVRYLRAAGFDPLSLPEFFSKLRYAEPRLPQTLSAGDLIALRSRIEDEIPPHPGYIITTAAFDSMRGRLVREQGSKRPPRPPTLTKRGRTYQAP